MQQDNLTGVTSNIKILLIAVLLLKGISVSANEYIPPPPGPYQSAVVIDMVEGDASQKHRVYKFPQADLFQSNERNFTLPGTSPPLSGLIEKPLDQDSNSYKNPQIDTTMPLSSEVYPRSNIDATTPSWYGPRVNNNPWAASTQPPDQSYRNGWNNQNYGYGYYYPYPNQYRRQKNRFDMPFSMMPSPWTMQPSKPYTGR